MDTNANRNNSWLKLEQNLSKTTSIVDLPFLPQSIKKLNYSNNATIHTTLTARWKTNKITESPLAPCRYSPIWHNPDFQLNHTSIYFPSWQQGITLHHLFQNNQFLSFNALIQKYGLGKDQFLRYQQLKSVIKSKISITNNTLQLAKLGEEIMKIRQKKSSLNLINSSPSLLPPYH